MKTVLVQGAVVAAVVGGWEVPRYVQRGEASILEIAEASDFAIRMEKFNAKARVPGKLKSEQALWPQLGEQLAFLRSNSFTSRRTFFRSIRPIPMSDSLNWQKTEEMTPPRWTCSKMR